MSNQSNDQPPAPWTWHRLRLLVSDLGLQPGSYVAGATAVLLADGTLQHTENMQLIVTDAVYDDLEARGWKHSDFGLTSPLHPGLTISQFDLTAAFVAQPDDLIRRAQTIHGVQVPPRELLSAEASRIQVAYEDHLRRHDREIGFLANHRRLLIAIASMVGVVAVLLVILNSVGGFQHLFGDGTTKVQGEIIEVDEGGPRCTKDSDYQDDPYTVVYEWTSGGEQHTAEWERCSKEAPQVGDPQALWINDDDELVSTASPRTDLLVGIAIGVVVFGAVAVFIVVQRRRSRSRQ